MLWNRFSSACSSSWANESQPMKGNVKWHINTGSVTIPMLLGGSSTCSCRNSAEYSLTRPVWPLRLDLVTATQVRTFPLDTKLFPRTSSPYGRFSRPFLPARDIPSNPALECSLFSWRKTFGYWVPLIITVTAKATSFKFCMRVLSIKQKKIRLKFREK